MTVRFEPNIIFTIELADGSSVALTKTTPCGQTRMRGYWARVAIDGRHMWLGVECAPLHRIRAAVEACTTWRAVAVAVDSDRFYTPVEVVVMPPMEFTHLQARASALIAAAAAQVSRKGLVGHAASLMLLVDEIHSI